ncbi:hypothetical protein B0H14DRAFT_3435345 [Mycena olivaceomarginata]|nr:hypothetical protein B0H14DRAFT_3435345 [Mycena olivaceomarginata]
MTALALFPEELLERILLEAVVAPASPHPRAPWHLHPDSRGKLQTRGRTAPLLVSRAFHRIALPLFYHTLVLHSPRQSAALLDALRDQPDLVRGVRTLVLSNPCAADAEVLRMLPKLLVLDALSVRKGARTYLSQPAPRAMLDALADAVGYCPHLHTATLSFPLSADPALCSLTAALAAAPALHTSPHASPHVLDVRVLSRWRRMRRWSACVSAGRPSCRLLRQRTLLHRPWSARRGLLHPPQAPERRAGSFSHHPASAASWYRPRPLLPTSLFLSAARPHTRLTELIKAGTDIAVGWRGRAATVGAGMGC